MGEEAEPISSTVPKLPLFSPHEHKETMPSSSSPIHHTLASVPFQWEKKPGKPYNNLPIKSTFNNNIKPKCLEPPPRLYAINTPSPNTVLDGPYNNINAKPKFSSSSFRFLKNISKTPETEQFSSFVKRGNWWKLNVKRKGGSSNSSVYLSSMDSTGNSDEGRSCSARMASFRTNIGSSSNLSASKSSHVWAHVYEGFKKAIPWKSSKSKNISTYNFQRKQSF